jgi:hypothetical protein
MTPKVSRYLGHTIMVSIPALFDDGACRPFTLLGAELSGLWLQSDELTRRLLPGDKQTVASTRCTVFVPFAQIAGVLIAGGSPVQPAAQSPSPETASAEPADSTKTATPPPESADGGKSSQAAQTAVRGRRPRPDRQRDRQGNP